MSRAKFCGTCGKKFVVVEEFCTNCGNEVGLTHLTLLKKQETKTIAKTKKQSKSRLSQAIRTIFKRFDG